MRSEVIEFNKTQRKDTVKFRAGDVVKVHRKIKEGNKERIQIFEGMILAMKGGQSSSPMMTVRKVTNGVGVEIVIPIFSPHIKKIELVKRAKVRQSKLYYVRNKAAKALRFKFTDGSEIVPTKDTPKKEIKEPITKDDK
jgi:large subunit ribosomal protein L19